MNITKLAPLGVALLFTAYLHGTKTTDNTKVNTKENKTNQTELSQIDPNGCSAITFSFKVWHDNAFDKKEFAKIVKQFSDLLKVCKQSDKDGTGFDPIVKIIGKPFDSMFEKVIGKDGFSVNLITNVNTKDDETSEDMISLECTIAHEETYDKKIWQEAISAGLNFFGEEQWIQKLAPLFTNVINTSNKSGIHGSLNISTETTNI